MPVPQRENAVVLGQRQELGFYNCFGCGKSGDVITFVREIEHLDFVGAVEWLANKAGITLRYTETTRANRKKRTELIEADRARRSSGTTSACCSGADAEAGPRLPALAGLRR